MDKRKSLGHNPLAYSLRNHSSLDFIRDTGKDTGQEEEKGKPSPKKVVSYYLEERTIQKLREMADQKGISYSAFVNKLLAEQLRDDEQKEG